MDSTAKHEEEQYLELIKDVIKNGVKRATRNGSVTRSLFGKTMTFSLENGTLPLLTTKKVFFRGVVEELLWFLRGETDSKILEAKGVNIWKGHTSREHLDSCGLTAYNVGEAGPIYSSQWRSWGKSTQAGLDGEDQIQSLIEGLKKDPFGRRHIVSAWNVSQLADMALPPCHVLFQFYVDNQRGLHCQFYQRSADIGLGVPFNIASYALLTHIIAKVTNLEPKRLIQVIGDAHVYEDHVEALSKQAMLVPKPFPKFSLGVEIDSEADFDSLRFEHFKVENYGCHPTVKMKMIV